MNGKYDLIIVGTGFASSFFLKKFLESTGPSVRVLVLERGQYFDHETRLKARKNEIPTPDALETHMDTYTSDYNKPWPFETNFGGCSNCWTGCVPRFMPNDFKMKSKYGIGVDWPISYDYLDPFYNEAEEIMAVAGPEITPFPRTKSYPLPPHALSTVDKVMQKHYGELYISQPAARATRPVGKRSMCCSSSTCGLCPVNSKFTIDNSLKYLYDDERVTLQESAQVVELRIENKLAKSVVVKLQDKEVEYFGETIALGANAIFNAHILLNSGDTSKWTGVGLSEQVGTFVSVYLDGLDNVGGSSLISANGYMFYDFKDRDKYAGCIIESLNAPYIRSEQDRWRQIAIFKFVFEDLPLNHNYVAASKDRYKPSLVFTDISEYAKAGIRNLQANVEKYFSVLPVEKIEFDGYNQPTEFHICGTTRMSDAAADGVVDKAMVHHQYRNVLVLGSGAFPTISPANPTLTLSALSLMAASNYFRQS